MPEKIEYEKLATGYEFTPAVFRLEKEKMIDYLNAVEDKNLIYEENDTVPPMAIAALSMAAMSRSMSLPDGAIHTNQNLEFHKTVSPGEELVSYAKVVRKVERGKFHMLTIGINVQNRNKATVLSGETGFILPLPSAEEK